MRPNPFITDWNKRSVSSMMTTGEADRLRAHFQDRLRSTVPIEPDEITSVARFLEVIENTSGNAFYRGENMNYGNISAAALRPHIHNREKSIYNVDELLSDFYRETFAGLSSNENEHFLAFAQHHGIPTNLLDITSNPLVALFFGCSGQENKDGLVWFFKDYHIDVTDLLGSEALPNSVSAFQKLCDDKALRERFTTRLYDFRGKHLIDGILEKCAEIIALIRDVRGLAKTKALLDSLHERYIESNRQAWDNVALKTNKSWYKADELFHSGVFEVLCQKGEYLNIIDGYLTFIRNDTEQVYPALLREAFSICADYAGADNISPGMGHNETYEVNFLPNILYRPLLSFGRAERQVGAFFAQPYYYANKVLFYQGMGNVSGVRIKADCKGRILEVLDRMDVNERTIFKDYDHIAAYVTRRYRKKL